MGEANEKKTQEKELKFLDSTHTYLLDKRKVPSVTQLLKPISRILYSHISLPILQRKAIIGSKVHKLIEYNSKYNLMPNEETTNPEVLAYFNQYISWNNTLEHVALMESEFKGFYSKGKVKFAGTIDDIRMIGNDLVVTDWKTVATPNLMILSLQLYGYKLIVEQRLKICPNKFQALCLGKESYELVDLTDYVNDPSTKELFDLLFKLDDLLRFSGLINDSDLYNEEDF